MIDLREVRSVTEFQRNIKEYVERLKEKGTPLVLTVNGRAEIVVQDADSYQLMLERLEHADTVAALRLGIEQAGRGEGIPLETPRHCSGRSMAFRVEIEPRAFNDLDSIAGYIKEKAASPLPRGGSMA